MTDILYFECLSGASGDMILSALLDLTGNIEDFKQAMEGLPLDDVTVSIERTTRHHIGCLTLTVNQGPQPLRHREDLLSIIYASRFSPWVKEQAIGVVEELARAEATVHQVSIDDIHFHEIGAADTLVDILGAFYLLDCLGRPTVSCSALNVGHGTIEAAHGILPVPAPATARLLAGIPVFTNDEAGELVTPTGAALIRSFTDTFGHLPPMRLQAIGYGAGQRHGRNIPNILRVFLGTRLDEDTSQQQLIMLECSIDDMNPENYHYVMEQLFSKGALDVTLTPLYMKKNRPGVQLSVLAQPAARHTLEQIIFTETTTLGIRRTNIERTSLDRQQLAVSVHEQIINVKVAILEGKALGFHPEYDDCVAAAKVTGLPLRTIQQTARRQAMTLFDDNGFPAVERSET